MRVHMDISLLRIFICMLVHNCFTYCLTYAVTGERGWKSKHWLSFRIKPTWIYSDQLPHTYVHRIVLLCIPFPSMRLSSVRQKQHGKNCLKNARQIQSENHHDVTISDTFSLVFHASKIYRIMSFADFSKLWGHRDLTQQSQGITIS